MTRLTGRLKVLTATASLIVLASMAVPSQSGGLGGVVGGVTGAAGGVVGGVTGSVGGVVGGATGHTGGVVGGATNSTTSQGLASHDISPTTKNGILHSNKALMKLRANVLGIKAGVYVLDRYGNLIRINVTAADLLRAKANIYALRGGSLVKVSAKVALAGLKVKGKVFVIDRHGNLLKGKVFVGLGELKAKVGAKVDLKPVSVKVGVSLGGNRPRTPGDPGNPGNPNDPGNRNNPPGGIDDGIAALSAHERDQLKKRCVSVLSNPAAYNRDAVQVCRVLAQLAGL
jgi:hypothetical protein